MTACAMCFGTPACDDELLMLQFTLWVLLVYIPRDRAAWFRHFCSLAYSNTRASVVSLWVCVALGISIFYSIHLLRITKA